MPEQMIEKLKKRILPEWKICFFASLIFGLVAHLYKITNWLPNWDSLVFRYDGQNMLAMGRWFLPIVCAPSSFYDLPLLAGLLAIILHGLGAVCICKMFGVKKPITAALIGALIATFPTVTSVMMYNYVADGYALAFLFSCLAAMLLMQEKPNYLGAIVLLALSVGIYQAYITVTITLLLLRLIFDVLYRNADFKAVLTKGLKFLVAGGLGMGLYYLVLTLLLKITGTELLQYQGFDSAANLQGIDIFGALYIAKEAFLGYFFDFSTGITVFGTVNCAILVLAVVLYLIDVVKNKLSITRILMLVVLTALLPLGASVLAFLNSGIDYHNLMKMGFVVFYLLLILQYEKSEGCPLKSWAILCVVATLVFNQVVIANVSYHKLNMAYEKSYGTLVRIADRIEQTEGALACDKILFLGHLPESEAYSANVSLDMTGTTDGYILRADDEIVGQSVLCSALGDYCGTNYKFLAGEEKRALLETIDESALGCWPAKNAILVQDGVIVIKLGD